MEPQEWIAVLFFAHVALAAVVRYRMPPGRRLTALTGSVAAALAVVAVSRAGNTALRNWAPMGFVLAAYYLSGRTFFSPNPRVESWLAAIDRRIFGDPSRAFSRWPSALVRALDAAYIGCFLLLPAGLVLLVAAGHGDRSSHYWTLVVGAELAAFAPLPYLQTRPPWVLERLDARGPRASVAFMRHATTGANTLPSGHAAGSLAVALAVIETMPTEGTILLALAITISIAAVITRAHFVVDIVTGVALAGLVWWLAHGVGL